MKTLIRIAVCSVASVILLAVVYWQLQFTTISTEIDNIIISSRLPEDVLSVSVENESGLFRFYFDAEEGGYVVDDIPAHLVDIGAFYRFLVNSARVFAISRISADSAGLPDFGLSPPRASVEIEFFDSEILRLNIGDVERVSGNFYATVEGFEDVLIFPQGIAEQFLNPGTQVISLLLTPPLALSSPLSAIRDVIIVGGSLESPVTILSTTDADEDVELAALSFGIATHIVLAEGVYQLDQAYGIAMLGALFEIRAARIVGYDLSNEELSHFGFDEPYMAVDFDMVNGADAPAVAVMLRFAHAADGFYYATRLGSGAVYLVSRQEFFDIEFERLILRWFLTPFLMDLTAITVEMENEHHRFEIDSSDARSIQAFYNGEPLDMESFHTFFRLITSAAHDGVYLGVLPLPQEAPLMTITYEYVDQRKENDVMALFPGEARRANVFINGIGEFAMNDLFIQHVAERVGSLMGLLR